MKQVPKSVSSSVSLQINNVQTKGVHAAYINGKTSIKGKGETHSIGTIACLKLKLSKIFSPFKIF